MGMGILQKGDMGLADVLWLRGRMILRDLVVRPGRLESRDGVKN
jgi:hypothetical protein